MTNTLASITAAPAVSALPPASRDPAPAPAVPAAASASPSAPAQASAPASAPAPAPSSGSASSDKSFASQEESRLTLSVARGDNGVFVYTLTDSGTGAVVAVIPRMTVDTKQTGRQVDQKV